MVMMANVAAADMRILVTLLLDTLPMLGNILMLCFFIFSIFGIIGVQMWKGLLRQRCFVPDVNVSIARSVYPRTLVVSSHRAESQTRDCCKRHHGNSGHAALPRKFWNVRNAARKIDKSTKLMYKSGSWLEDVCTIPVLCVYHIQSSIC